MTVISRDNAPSFRCILLRLLFLFAVLTGLTPACLAITGGMRDGNSRYVVKINIKYGANLQSTATCTGSLITPTWILTAAHCFQNSTYLSIDPANTKVQFATILGSTNDLSINPLTLGVNRIEFEPNDVDAALISLSSQAPEEDYEPQRYGGASTPSVGFPVKIRGYSPESPMPLTLQVGDFNVVARSSIDNQRQPGPASAYIYTGSNIADTQLGDSGGPLTVANTICGVFTSGDTVNPPTGIAGYSTSVSTAYLAPWITSETGQGPSPLFPCNARINAATLTNTSVNAVALGNGTTQGVTSTDNAGPRGVLYSFISGATYAAVALIGSGVLRRESPLVMDLDGALTSGTVNMVGRKVTGGGGEPDHEGYPGYTIDQVAATAKCSIPYYRPNLVPLTVGTDDILQNIDLANAPARLTALIQQIISDSPKAVVLVSDIPPNTLASQPNLEQEIQAYNSALPGVVQSLQNQGLHVVFAPGLLTADQVGPDNVDPTDAGYDQIAAGFWSGTAEAIENGWLQEPDPLGSLPAGCAGPDTGGGAPNLLGGFGGEPAPFGADPLPPFTVGETGIRRPDPSVISVNGVFYMVESDNDASPNYISVRAASSLAGLVNAEPVPIFSDTQKLGEVWAPEIMYINNTFYVYFSMGAGTAHRMYAITSANPESGYSAPQQLALTNTPGNTNPWAIDGTRFVFDGQPYFVWSGWPVPTNVEQDLFIVKLMPDNITPTGPSTLISRPDQPWELKVGIPNVNEAPEAIMDPNGQVHIVYSTNGSWSAQYCLADLRLAAGNDPLDSASWHKSNGCVVDSDPTTAELGWPLIKNAQGPGHNTFALVNGDINATPPLPIGQSSPFLYAAVPAGLPYMWSNRVRYIGQYTWWPKIPYYAGGSVVDTGYSLGFAEDPSAPTPTSPATPGPPSTIPGTTDIHNADPSVIRVGSSTYISVEVDPNGPGSWNIAIRQASSADALGAAPTRAIQTVSAAEVWAPKIQLIGGLYYIYYSQAATPGGLHFMQYIVLNSALTAQSSGQLNLPDGKFATDGSTFTFQGQLYFVWSGWPGDTNVEQDLYIVPMTNNNPTTPGPTRILISQPREPWELRAANPAINEAPEAIIDPNGQLHIDYSANGSWSNEYCIADLRLRAGGDITNIWDWYKSNGCLMGSDRSTMMAEWDPTAYVQGPGSHSFVLLNGDVATSPANGAIVPLMYTAVPNGTSYSWANRHWFNGSFTWWGNTIYSRIYPPGFATSDTGYSIKYFEDPNFGTPKAAPAPPPPPPSPGFTGIRNADPSVIRVGNTYISVETDGFSIYTRQASSTTALGSAPPVKIFTAVVPWMWAPKIIFNSCTLSDCDLKYYVYYSNLTDATDSTSRRMHVLILNSPTDTTGVGQLMSLPGNRWATDGNPFIFNKTRYFVWSGWPAGKINVEQDLYLAPLSGMTGVGAPTDFSQPIEPWELTVGNPNINEAPIPIIDPAGQLHITYSANGSWSDQYCLVDLRLNANANVLFSGSGWYKSMGCMMGSNYGNMMAGWDETVFANGTASHSYVLENGDISTSPPANAVFPLMYTAVPKDTVYSWANRQWFAGSFEWWGNATYTLSNPNLVNAPFGGLPLTNTGWGLKFFEGPTAP